MILSKPEHGWTDITIGKWTDRASYLTDVHLDFLKCLIRFFETNSPSCFQCDAEGWNYTIVISDNYVHTIEEKDEIEFYSFDFYEENITIKDFARMVYNDILTYIDDWSCWDPCTDLNDMGDIENSKKEIQEKLEKLKKYIND